MGVFKDKDYEEILRIMLPVADSFCAIDLPDRKRGLPSGKLAEAADKVKSEMEDIRKDLTIGTAKSLDEALKDAVPSEENIYLVFGSLSIMQLFR